MRVNNKKSVTGTKRNRKKSIPNIDKSGNLARFDNYDCVYSFLMDQVKKNALSDGTDSILISAIAKELVLYHDCMKEVERDGVIIEFVNGAQSMKQINPSYKAAKIALDNIRAMCKECGFTIKARVLMSGHLIEKEEEQIDPIAEAMQKAKMRRIG